MIPADRDRWETAAGIVRSGLATRHAVGLPARVSRRTFRRLVRAYLELESSMESGGSDSVATAATETARDARGRFVRREAAGG